MFEPFSITELTSTGLSSNQAFMVRLELRFVKVQQLDSHLTPFTYQL